MLSLYKVIILIESIARLVIVIYFKKLFTLVAKEVLK